MIRVRLFILFLLCTLQALAHRDTVILSNGDLIAGQIKLMERGILTYKTEYSSSDFKIEWKHVIHISSEHDFLISLMNGIRVTGKLFLTEDKTAMIQTPDSSVIRCALSSILFLRPIDNKIWDHFNATLDFGYSHTKANNLKQLTARSTIGFVSEKYAYEVSLNTLNSVQDNTETIRRTDGALTYSYYLPGDWYIPAATTFLSNTEQQIALRSLAKLGIGNFVVRTNSAYWGFAGGGNYNSEKFFNETPANQSWETFLSTELNLYDIGNLSLLTKVFVYSGITEKGRWRSDINFDTKYKLPRDFYIRFGITFNYDNKPANNAPETDYVTQLTFGWTWKK